MANKDNGIVLMNEEDCTNEVSDNLEKMTLDEKSELIKQIEANINVIQSLLCRSEVRSVPFRFQTYSNTSHHLKKQLAILKDEVLKEYEKPGECVEKKPRESVENLKMVKVVKNAPPPEKPATLTAEEKLQYIFARFFTARPQTEDEEKITVEELNHSRDFYYEKCSLLHKILTKRSPSVFMTRLLLHRSVLSSCITLQDLAFMAETYLLEYDMAESELNTNATLMEEDGLEKIFRYCRKSFRYLRVLQDYESRTTEKCVQTLILYYFHAERIENQLRQQANKQKEERVTSKTVENSAGNSEHRKLESERADNHSKSEGKELEYEKRKDHNLENKKGTDAGLSKSKVENNSAVDNVRKDKNSMECEDVDYVDVNGRRYKPDSLFYYLFSKKVLSPEQRLRFKLEFLDMYKQFIRRNLLFYRRTRAPFSTPSDETLEKFHKIELYKPNKKAGKDFDPFLILYGQLSSKVPSDWSTKELFL